MADHLHFHELYQSATVTITEVRCRPQGPQCGGEECSSGPEIVVPRAGVFVKHVRGERIVADSNHALFFNGGEPYRVSHPVAGGDDCTILAFAHHILVEAISRYEPAVRDRPAAPFSMTHGPNEPRNAFLQQRLRQRFHGNVPCPIAANDTALQLLAAILHCAYRVRGRRPARLRPATARLHRDRAEAAKEFLAARFRARLSLDDVARAVHCSPYHLARLFRREVGVSVHQYLSRLRLGAALDQLADGVPDLTALALELGYSSHSHFTEAFRRAFGSSPSSFRGTVTAARLRQMSKNLKA